MTACLQWSRFTDLSLESLYALLKLRSEVFVVEQNCVFADPDGLDPQAWHLLAWAEDGALVGCARIFLPAAEDGVGPASSVRPAGMASLGRVVTAPQARGQGLGRQLVLACLQQIQALAGPVPVRIGAQSYLESFYTSLGFSAWGSPFLEDGILHRPMRYLPPAPVADDAGMMTAASEGAG